MFPKQAIVFLNYQVSSLYHHCNGYFILLLETGIRMTGWKGQQTTIGSTCLTLIYHVCISILSIIYSCLHENSTCSSVNDKTPWPTHLFVSHSEVQNSNIVFVQQ